MAEIIWTESALNDLNEIAEYIELSNPIAAADLVRDLVTKVERLEQFPKSGRILPEITELNYREVVVPPCRVFYRADKTSVYIVHICREERDLRKFLIARGSLWID
jgi:toxin ParE1/3/4